LKFNKEINDDNTISINEEHVESNIKAEKNCSNCLKKATKRCSSCQSVVYCSKECQIDDHENHSKVCKILGNESITLNYEESSNKNWILVNTQKNNNYNKDKITDRTKLKRFIVKIQNGELYDKSLTLYNESRNIVMSGFNSNHLYNILLHKGILGSNQLTSKKIFCYAMFENQNVLKIFTYELAPFKSW
jgi:hypothetical protein